MKRIWLLCALGLLVLLLPGATQAHPPLPATADKQPGPARGGAVGPQADPASPIPPNRTPGERLARPASTIWHLETVDSAGSVGFFLSMALDSMARPHIAYYDSTNDDLKYAYYDGAQWQIEVVDPAGNRGYSCSLALDAAGRPHISYIDFHQYNSALYYAWHDGTSWQIEAVDSSHNVSETSLALDSAGHPHIAYWDASPGDDLWYAWHDGVQWHTELVDSNGNVGSYPSLALDSLDRPHISYHSTRPTDDLKYAYYDGSQWHIETVEIGQTGDYTSLVLDASDLPHIAYCGSWAVKYARYDGSSWHIEAIDSTGTSGGYTSLALDTAGRPSISYFNDYEHALKLARYDGSAWSTERIDFMGPDSGSSSLALNPSGHPRIAYYWGGAGDLKYASGSPCIPVEETAIYGPARVSVGSTVFYSATFAPITASLPIFSWDHGAVGATAAYSWTNPGIYTITVTATNPCGQAQGTFTVTVFCDPVQEAVIDGPDRLSAGITGFYSATYHPITASLPALAWDHGSFGPSATYSWTIPGVYTVSITATNPCSQVQGHFSTTVFCQPMDQVTIDGPSRVLVGHQELFHAFPQPITSSLPIVYRWDNGAVGPTAVYSWTWAGSYTVTMTATNLCSTAYYTVPVHVSRYRWMTERVDDLPLFSHMRDRSLVLDEQGHPHIAYGRDHLYYAYYDGASWHTETVDSDGAAGIYAALALDAAGRPHISYGKAYANGRGDLKYAWYDGTQWHVTLVDDDGKSGGNTSLVLDAAGHPHISYSYETPTLGIDYDSDLRYAYLDGSIWVTTTVDSTGRVGYYTSIDLDSAGHPGITYNGVGSNTFLKYASYDGATWHIQTVRDGLDTWGYSSSLALDANDYPHVSYMNANLYLAYSYFDGSAWVHQDVDMTPDAGWYTSLALDASGLPHISYCWYDYYAQTCRELRYAHFDGSSWLLETLDGERGAGAYTSLALDPLTGRPGISYCLYDNNYRTCKELRYAHWGDAGWQLETPDRAGSVGRFTSLALDDVGRPRISYRSDWPASGLRYAQYNGSTWEKKTVDSTGDAGGWTSLALDTNNLPHISYQEYAGGTLRYAFYDGASWVTQTVSTPGTPGGFSSLALDAANQPHICYFDALNSDLKYAHSESGNSWQIESVDRSAAPSWTGSPSLVLDADGYPHVAYYDDSWHVIKYAYKDGTGWQVQTVDSLYDGSGWTSLALGPSGQPHISYVSDDGPFHDLKYAYYEARSGTWQKTVVDRSLGQDGGYTSIALDGEGRPRISYFDATLGLIAYAYLEGSTWITETAAPQVTHYSGFTSLALDPIERPHISLYDSANGDLIYAYIAEDPCAPVEGVTVSGPARLLSGETGLYTATAAPPTADLPIHYTWDNDSTGPTAAYSWTVPGLYTMTVTSTNSCGQASATWLVEVRCVPLESLTVGGPSSLPIGRPGAYTATVLPLTATLPIDYTWDNGSTGPTATYSWTLPGIYTVTVTATNPCGLISGTRIVEVFDPCQPVVEAAVNGPNSLLPGQVGLYTATYAPPTATLPVTLTWDNGSIGATANYSWTAPGLYSVTVIATNGCGHASETMLVEVLPQCQPVTEVEVSGPALLLPDQEGLYTATYAPLTATWPVNFVWGNGLTGPTAIYSWTVPGLYTLTVTATNACGAVSSTVVIQVLASCQPVEEVVVNGPTSLLPGQEGLYTATYAPPTATLPISFVWDNGGIGSTSVYSWTMPGSYSLTVVASGPCNSMVASFSVDVVPVLFQVYLPLILNGR